MRKLLFLILLISGVAQAQNIPVLMGPFPTHTFGGATVTNASTNLKIPAYIHIPASLQRHIDNGTIPDTLYGLIDDNHGIGERSQGFASVASITTADLPRLYNNGMPQFTRYTNSKYVGKKYAAVGKADSIEFIYVYPQVWGNHGYNFYAYTFDVIKYMKENYGKYIDTNRIYLTGLSFGAGGIICAMQDPSIANQVAGIFGSCPGYNDLTGYPGETAHWKDLDTSQFKGFFILEHSQDDEQTTNGAQWSNRTMDTLIKYKSKCTYVYHRWTSGGHNVWYRWQNPDNALILYPMTNGQNWVHSVPWQSLLLTYSKN